MALAHSKVLAHGTLVARDNLVRSSGQVLHSVRLGTDNGESPEKRGGILCSCGGSPLEEEVEEEEVVVVVVEEVEDDMVSHGGASWHGGGLACDGRVHVHNHDLHG